MKTHSAFSLVELLVTITITGILFAISVAAYDEYKKRAYDTVALVAIRDIGVVAEMLEDLVQESVVDPSQDVILRCRNLGDKSYNSFSCPENTNNTLSRTYEDLISPGILEDQDLFVFAQVTRNQDDSTSNSSNTGYNLNVYHCKGLNFYYQQKNYSGTVIKGDLPGGMFHFTYCS